jgi:DNA repair protein RecO (recombination protein O)
MKQVVTTGIVLARTDYGEADRIITLLTPDHGKLRLMAKGVRRIKSKLAGGIELFSVSEITFIPGRREIHTLVSSRLQTHYGQIVKDITRTMRTYDLLKRLNRVTEDATGPEYFDLLNAALAALDAGISEAVVELWFDAQLLRLAGHQPNLQTDAAGQRLQPEAYYTFDTDSMVFTASSHAPYHAGHIKLLRLAFGADTPRSLARVQRVGALLPACGQLVAGMRQRHIL